VRLRRAVFRAPPKSMPKTRSWPNIASAWVCRQAQVQPLGQGSQVQAHRGGDLADRLAKEQQDQRSDPQVQGGCCGFDAMLDEVQAFAVG
jgi:hypothetical protein